MGVKGYSSDKYRLSIVVDANNLCWIAYHSLPELSMDGRRTEVAFGFLNRILRLAKECKYSEYVKGARLIFCFDSHSKYSIRRKILSDYKGNRARNRDKEKEREVVFNQIKTLKEEILPSLGFKNIFEMKGLEADDLIAWLAHVDNPQSDEITPMMIVSSDDDLMQCIRYDVRRYNPRKKVVMDIESYWKWLESIGVRPMGPQYYYALMKAIAGCKTDNIKGDNKIKGASEIKAWKYIMDELPEGKLKQKINSVQGQRLVARNMKLVRLPFGCNNLKRYRKIKVKQEILFKDDFRTVFNRYWFKYFLKREIFEQWERRLNLR